MRKSHYLLFGVAGATFGFVALAPGHAGAQADSLTNDGSMEQPASPAAEASPGQQGEIDSWPPEMQSAYAAWPEFVETFESCAYLQQPDFGPAPTGDLIAGDQFMDGGTVVIAPPDGHMGDYLASLRRLRAEPIQRILPAHGNPLSPPIDIIDGVIAHRLAREAKVIAGLEQFGEPATLDALLPVVYADVPAALHPLAARSLIAHLDKLVDDGRVHHRDHHWTLIQPT